MDSQEFEPGRRFTVSIPFNKDHYKHDIMGLRGPMSMFAPSRNHQLARYAGRSLDRRKRMKFFPLAACSFAGTDVPRDRFMNPEALGSIASMRNRPNKDNDEGSSGGGNVQDNDEGSRGGRNGIDNDEGSSGGGNVQDNDEGSRGGRNGIENDEGSRRGGNVQDNDEGSRRGGRGGNDILIKTLTGVGHVIRRVVCLYLLYKTGKSIESIGREIVGAVRGWKEEGFPALANIKFEKVNLVDIKIEKLDLKFSIY